MSHEVRYGIYDENVDKGYVQSYWDEYASHEDWQEGCTGLHKKIRWIDISVIPMKKQRYI